MRKLLCELKYRVATEDRNNIIYETDCSNLEAVYFGESKRSLKSCSDERKRDMLGIWLVKRIKLQNTVGNRTKLLIGKAD